MKRLRSSVLCLSVSGLAWAALNPFAPRGPQLGQVTKSDIVQRVTVAGQLIPYRKTVFTPSFAGYIQKIHVKLGETVKTGSPVVTVVQSLAGGGTGYPMRAPFDGTVTQVLRSEGEYVDAGKDYPIVRLDDLSRLYLQSDVPEMEIAKIRVGQEVVVRANAVLDRSYKGIIRDISRAAKDRERWGRQGDRVEFDVRMEVLDKDDALRPGMSAVIDVITAKRTKVLSLGHEYILRRGDDYVVTMADGQERKIEVGLRNEELFEIVKGLKDKDRVKVVDFYSMEK